ncbi:50S ribosomal protein L4 [Candidatus Curtissbacteria bacterium RIFCSPHIGHO2_01_FULL_41_44]|uniref:Large ribosomal subunit protein uL4 n=1 Tax=Candidatus Curtissbacteria bacterium RIFCSPLOWO2_01_FULL_42_50 TaxID=1797730 RepID=A0A1F5H2J1_9BACT|nr:MAG: 50S ribosomal protein L4 [Candidatus Curtissbacteria bacterium RIFCSPHIGHO2_02_FULL_42_58]OGD94800.1 MAG: 50S ribosomal protein L4 [Candidatus Curtissbacteria bacterium RIFCSPHIGHO2_01_FULL_41_44]OGD96344.1 MAG: 50S ribosomal protein L4 [Candidatus Curtissbacteria bacterium RIFCSPHIGHO2_12_FULL_42_33]OGD98366.1 MAG: 50S ribosomal protein L4 [Candidatus Curtissbacteria bacterium RIFCSPLOWO2_01_FULL_42_50]OGE03019.1 MAG: 50S ribosomal protein L4 [Candidatus Curtissbacteria bacterium RIFCS
MPKLAAQVFDTQGRVQGTINLPKEIFGQTPNQNLLAQAVRVYFANQSGHFANTKTRSEVRGGGRKPHRQKGTGRARAGSIRSPLWVGGGKAFGPHYREVKLSLPKKMKHKALIHSLSLKFKSGHIKVIQNIEKIEPKTKIIANLLLKLRAKGDTLLVLSANPPAGGKNVKLASRNISQVSVETAQNLNANIVLKNNQLLISKEAVSSFQIK